MAFSLPNLEYSYDALEPSIDVKTMEIHHGKHHGGYVNNLNAAVGKYEELQSKTVEELISGINKLPDDVRNAIRNNGGGHFNHTFFWESLTPKSPKKPVGKLAEEIDKRYGSFERLKEEFTKAATTRFGSGWAWLVVDNGELQTTSTPNQDNPTMDIGRSSAIPILGLDVWEHAYYLKYQNRRPEYVSAFWDIINWEKVNDRFMKL